MKLPKAMSAGRIWQLWKGNPFPRALILSVVFHVCFFLQLAFLLAMFEPPTVHTPPPLVYDFVFSPEEKKTDETVKGETSSGEQTEKAPAQSRKLLAVNSLSDIDHLADLQMLEEIPVPDLLPRPLPDLIDSKPAGRPQKPANSTVDAVDASHPSLPASARPDTKPVLAKIGLSEIELEMIHKRARKWSEDFYKMELEDSTVTWEHKGRLYRATFRHQAARNETDMDELGVTIETEKDGFDVATELRMRRLAFSNFAQFVDYWDPRVAFHDDRLEGRFHSNSEIRIHTSGKAKPEFQGRVTTASFDVKPVGLIPYLDRESMFPEGLETGVKAIRLPKAFFLLESDTTIVSEEFLQLNEDAYLVFNGNGTLEWAIPETGKSGARRIGEDAFYIVGHKRKKLYIKGTVKGKILIYSPGTIEISDDLVYADDPEKGRSTDFLGIVSGKNVEIASPDATGPGDLRIFASIYAKGVFKVKDFDRGDNEDTLYIYGSLTAGTVFATEPRYATDIRFDHRLERQRAPNFPMSNRYELVEWDKRWQVQPKSNGLP
jgi:hypothetical protein